MHKILVNTGWKDSLLLVLPPMFLEFFICLSTWYICKSVRSGWKSWPRTVGVHLVSLVIINALWLSAILFYAGLQAPLLANGTSESLLTVSLPFFLGVGVSLYFISILIYYLELTNEDIRVTRQEALKQRILAGQAELNALKTTIHPHFLFNSLNMMSPLIDKSPERARDCMAHLSDFLLYSLRHGKKQRVAVMDELEHITDYLAIEKERLGERLKLEMEVAPDAERCDLPPLVLLPLVENAVKHGIGQCLHGGILHISVKREQGRLLVEVKNPYETPPHSAAPGGEGLGLDTLKKRIRAYYGSSGSVTVEKEEPGDKGAFFTVRLSVPCSMELTNEESD
ncbi:MAG: hypothetical protein GY765_25755 [bacterium]|nr:hypothetical protein [bacterium]